MPRRLDPEILARPDIDQFIFVTGDKGFGDWIFNKGLPQPLVIRLSRMPQPEWTTTAERLIAILERGVEPGQMVTITKDGVRTRPFSTGVSNG